LKLFLIILLVVATFALLLYFMPVKIKLKMLIRDNEDEITLRVYTLYGLIHHFLLGVIAEAVI
jgi:uncharacterized protein YgfB (UPF0149 family)